MAGQEGCELLPIVYLLLDRTFPATLQRALAVSTLVFPVSEGVKTESQCVGLVAKVSNVYDTVTLAYISEIG